MDDRPLILVTGATGYVGSRLVPELLKAGYRVRCLARRPQTLQPRPWFNAVEICQGDALDAGSLGPPMQGVHTAFYLIHNMSSGSMYREHEKTAAANFSQAAHAAGVEQIIYVSGLGEGSGEKHMASRRASGEALRANGVPVTELRASIIIGSGSISFEMIRSMTEWLPLIPAARQTNVPAQPIATSDLLAYLLAAIESPGCRGQIIEIGGRDTLPYPELMLTYARLRGLTRLRLPLPFFTPSLAARMADWLTPVPFNIARPLMEELVAPSIITQPSADRFFPAWHTLSAGEAMQKALARTEMSPDVPWMDSLNTRQPLEGAHVRTLGEGLLIDYRQVRGSPSAVLLRLFEGRKAAGWETEAHRAGAWVRLKASQKLPGVLRVEFRVKGDQLCMAALFEPDGLPGLLYWRLSYPLNAGRLRKMFSALRQ